jgi:hypothetical protein
VIKFSVDKDKEVAFRQTTDEWLKPQIPRVRLVGLKWYPAKADFIEVALAMDAENGKVSKSAMERFGTENGEEVCAMRWLGQPRLSGQHVSVVIKVATKEADSRSHGWLLKWRNVVQQDVYSWRILTAHTHRLPGHNRKHTHGEEAMVCRYG